MKTKIKLSIMSALFVLLTFASVAHSQNLDDMFRTPPPEFGHLSAGSVGTANTTRELYIGRYYFPDTKPKYGFLGIFVTKYGSILSAVNLKLKRGYLASVYGTFAGTNRYLCLPFPGGDNSAYSLNQFSDVDEITISKARLPDEVVLWVNNPNFPIAYIPGLNNIYDQPDARLLDAYAVWIPGGYWARLCKNHASYAKGTECVNYTSDRSNLPNRPFKVYQVGKGKPLTETKPLVTIPKSDMTKTPRQFPSGLITIPKPKPLPKAKPKPKSSS